MRKQVLLISALVLFVGCSAIMLSRHYDPTLGTFALESEKGNPMPHPSKAQIYADAEKWRFDRLKDENGNFDPSYVTQALLQADNFRLNNSRSNGLGLQWQELGPDNVGGRTRAILIDKRDATNQTIYAGGVSGGMWKSTDGAVTWTRLSAWNNWLGIASIAQGPAPDYNIYVGTGVGNDGTGNFYTGTSFASSHYGNGIFKLNAIDSPILITPNVMPGTLYNPNIAADQWFTVNRIAVNQTNANQIIAGTLKGLYRTTNGGLSWTQISLTPASLNSVMVSDVKWSNDGKNIFASFVSGTLVKSNDGGTTWTTVTSANSGYSTTSGRIELAIAPSKSNVVYALQASAAGATKGLYQSGDGGNTWITVAVGGPLFQLFEESGTTGSGQGGYDNTIAVSPSDPTKFYMGGVNFYTGSTSSGVHAADNYYGNESNPYYCHPDKHAIVIADNNPDLMFIGCDGGIFKSEDALASFPNPTYTARNRGYNVTQNYGIAAGLDGSVIGGAQDNGTNYINYYGNSFGSAAQVLGGDGMLNAVSQINTNFYFGAIYYAALYRSADHSATYSGYFDVKIDPNGQGGAGVCGANTVSGDASFCTPYYLGETKNAVNGSKKVAFVADRNYAAGDIASVTSATGDYQFNVTLSQSVDSGVSVQVDDPVRSRVFLSTVCGVYFTNDALNNKIIPRWYKLAPSITGNASSFVTTPDGNNLYIGTDAGYVFKYSNLNTHADTVSYPPGTSVGIAYLAASTDITKTVVASSRDIEGIDVDPTDNNHVVAVVAGFSTSNAQAHVYESHDGGVTWVADTTGLPNMPVYSVVVHDAHTIIIGTEFGVWSWDGSRWHEENTNLTRVPVYRMVERNLYADGCKVLYVGTHGRGMWRCTTLTPASCRTDIGTAVNNVKPNAITNLSVFPNPVRNSAKISLNLDNSANVTLRVFDMAGKLHKEISYHNAPAGTNLYDLDASELSSGNYLLSATVADTRTLSRMFVVTK